MSIQNRNPCQLSRSSEIYAIKRSIKKTFNNLFLLMCLFSLLSSVVIPVVSKKTDKNPYKTKQKIEQEEEFDAPELLGGKQVEPESESEGEEEPDKAPEIDKIAHSQELEIEATNKKEMFLNLLTIYEVVMLGLVILFMINCMIGVKTNDKMANSWVRQNKKFFENNYSHIGTDNQYNLDNPLLKESYSNFKFYASGRQYVNFVLVSIDLCKRFDLVTMASNLFFPAVKDRIIFDFSVNTSEVSHVFTICKKKDVKFMKKTYDDIDFMTKGYDADFLGKQMVLLTEDNEISDKIFTGKVRELYDQVEPFIDIIYFTDRQSYSKEQYVLFLSFNMNNFKNTSLCTEFSHALLEKIANLDIPLKKKQACDKLRTEFAEFKERERNKKLDSTEEEQQRKEEERRKKEASKSKPLTREQMIKQEEKEKKERLKKQQKKQMKIMK